MFFPALEPFLYPLSLYEVPTSFVRLDRVASKDAPRYIWIHICLYHTRFLGRFDPGLFFVSTTSVPSFISTFPDLPHPACHLAFDPICMPHACFPHPCLENCMAVLFVATVANSAPRWKCSSLDNSHVNACVLAPYTQPTLLVPLSGLGQDGQWIAGIMAAWAPCSSAHVASL